MADFVLGTGVGPDRIMRCELGTGVGTDDGAAEGGAKDVPADEGKVGAPPAPGNNTFRKTGLGAHVLELI